jgi:hypothetical protein
MSTKRSIKWRDHEQDKPGFHLYEDALDDLISGDGSPEPPVYLRLDGVQAQLQTMDGQGVSITVELPREMARAVGLLPLVDATR